MERSLLILALLWTVPCPGCARRPSIEERQPAATAQVSPGVDSAAESAASLPPEQPRETVPPQGEPVQPTAQNDAAAGVALQPLDWEGVQALIAERQGKVVVVDLWATYCVPCRQEFPGLVALSRQDPGNIACISVSLDAEADHARALAFLQEQQAEMTNVRCTTDADTLYDQVLQIGGIPAVYVYGRDGQLARLFNGPSPEGETYTYAEHISPFVTRLAEQPAAESQ